MRKKITVKQPDEQSRKTADDWVRGQSPQPQPKNNSANSEKLARLTIDLPQTLHSQFKATCAQRRTKMKDEILRLIKEYTR